MPANAAGPWVAASKVKGPSVVKELMISSVLALFAGGLWKMQQWKLQRKTKAFYDMLDKDQISVVVEDADD